MGYSEVGGHSGGLCKESRRTPMVENPGHVHGIQARSVRLLGFDHERLTHHTRGRDFRLSDVHGKVVEALLA
jgi:hypothetical protein